MNNEQRVARDFASLAGIHARDGGAVARELIAAMDTQARAACAELARDLAAALGEPAGSARDRVDTGISGSPGVAVSDPDAGARDRVNTTTQGPAAESDPDSVDNRGAASDAFPGLRRIVRG